MLSVSSFELYYTVRKYYYTITSGNVVVQVCAPPSVHDKSANGYHVGLPTYNLIKNGAHGDILSHPTCSVADNCN